MAGSSFGDLLQYPRLLQMMFVLGIGGSLQVGFQGSMITYTSVHVKALMNETSLERSGRLVAPSTLTLLWSLVVSIFALGGLLGTMASGRLTTKYGKKKCLLGNNLLMVLSAFLLGFSKMGRSSFELLLAGRFLCGISSGMILPLHSQYLGEVPPKKLRGFANSTAAIFWSLGKVTGQVLGQSELLGSATLWPLLMAFSGVLATIQLLTLPFFPESPPHLFLNKGDEEGCLEAMKRLWGEKYPHHLELEDLRKERAAQQSSQGRGRSLLGVAKEPSLRWQLYILILSGMTMQLSGIQAIYSYTFEVLNAAGFHQDHIPYLSLGVSTSELFSTFLCSFIIERFGRKVLLWGGYSLMATVLAFLTLTLSLQHWFFWMPYCSLCLIFCFVICFGSGPAGATTSVRMEIFDQSSRASAFVIAGVLNWAGFFVTGMAFPLMMESFRQFSFLVFMGALYAAGLFFYFFLPETKEKSILEIQEDFDKLNFKKKKVFVTETNIKENGIFCTRL